MVHIYLHHRRINNITNTVQFKEWFGKWKDHPETINPALLNEDGTPRVFYHGTPTYGFTAFREGEPIFLTSSEEAASTYSGVKGTPDSYHFAEVSKMNLNELAQFMTEHNNDGIVYSVEKVWDSLRQTNTDKIIANGDKNASYSRIDAIEIAERMPQTPGNYPMYVAAKNLLVIDNAENNRHIPIPDVLKKYFPGSGKTANTTEIAKAAQQAGFDGVMFKGIGDIGAYGASVAGSGKGTSDVIAVFKSTQVKSATDNNGMFSPYESDFNYQYRTGTLTDRDVLRYAAENLADKLKTDGQKYALQTFNEKLSKLDDLTIQREQLGREWHEQQFGTGDRSEAAATLNRMHTLDAMIEKANAEVLSIENKQVLKDVLVEARKVVEKAQETADMEKIARYKARHEQTMKMRVLKNEIRSNVDDLVRWTTNPKNKDNIHRMPDVLKGTVIPFIQSMDFTSKRALNGGKATKADESFLAGLENLSEKLRNAGGVDELYGGYVDLPPNFNARLEDYISKVRALTAGAEDGSLIINQMTEDELTELSEIVTALKKVVVNTNKFLAGSRFAHVYEAGDSSVNSLKTLAPAKKTGGRVVLPSADFFCV